MKLVLYSRCSTNKQDHESQIRQLEAWAAKGGHEYRLKADFGSGRDFTRQGLNEALALARAGQIEGIAVLELSRIGRSIKDIYAIAEELDRLGVKVILANSNTTLSTKTLEGRALLGGLALAADIEWMLLCERNKRAREQIRAKGIRLGRKPKDASLKAIEALRAQGLSVRQIAKEMNVSPATVFRRLSRKSGHLCDIAKAPPAEPKALTPEQARERLNPPVAKSEEN